MSNLQFLKRPYCKLKSLQSYACTSILYSVYSLYWLTAGLQALEAQKKRVCWDRTSDTGLLWFFTFCDGSCMCCSQLFWWHMRGFKMIPNNGHLTFPFSSWSVIFQEVWDKNVFPWHIFPFPLRKVHSQLCPFVLHYSGFTTWYHLCFQISI